MTPDFVLRLGYAAGRAMVSRRASLRADERADRRAERPSVLIGKDTRISGYMVEAALEAGFSAAGVDVLLCGPLPTPGVAYLTRALRLSAGVVISASHNPYADNGIKFFSRDGFKHADTVEAEIERLLDEPIGCNESAMLGRARHPCRNAFCSCFLQRLHHRQRVARFPDIVYAQYCRSMLDGEQSGRQARREPLSHCPPRQRPECRLARPARDHGKAQRHQVGQPFQQGEIVLHGLAETEARIDGDPVLFNTCYLTS